MAKIWICVLTFVLACGVAGGSAWAKGNKGDNKTPPTAEEKFKKLDKNNDGKLTKDEVVGQKEGEAKARAEKMWEKLDPTKKGSVTLEEFKKAMEGGRRGGKKRGK